MQWPSFSGPSQDQATRSVFILRVIFNHLRIAEDFSDFLYTDATNNALVNSMLGKLKLLDANFLSYLINQRHAQPPFTGISSF
jgi:hypothetical protein